MRELSDRSTAGPPPFEHWNFEDALRIVGGEMEFLHEIASACLQDFPGLLRQLGEAVESQDVTAVEHLAHQLKSRLSLLCAGDAFRAALGLERAAVREAIDDFPPQYAEFHRRIEKLLPELAAVVRANQYG